MVGDLVQAAGHAQQQGGYRRVHRADLQGGIQFPDTELDGLAAHAPYEVGHGRRVRADLLTFEIIG